MQNAVLTKCLAQPFLLLMAHCFDISVAVIRHVRRIFL